ncbi:MAG: DinB family protein [Cytophagales bacterium]|nr:DinB family protein [Cytophaga sp.]
MHFIIEATKQLRSNCLNLIKDLSDEQLHSIPPNYNNNIIWHLGHMFVSEQILCYAKSNTPLLIPEIYPTLYSKGTSPREWTSPADVQEVIRYMKLTGDALESDYQNKKFGYYNAYTTSAGSTLSTIEDAIAYSYGHENLHYGCIISMIKLVR